MTEVLWHTAVEALIDSFKLFPFLLATYLVLECLEEKAGSKTVNLIRRSGQAGPLIGALCGLFPQCGIAAAASNFYAARVISAGTLTAVYLSTSDEMLPILISHAVPASLIFKIFLIKIVAGLFFGSAVDFFARRSALLCPRAVDVETLCRNDDCQCEENGVWRSALRHSIKITLFVLVVSFLFNLLMEAIGPETMARFLAYPLAGAAAAGLIGLVPNCSASVIVTQLYLEGAIAFGAMMAGVLVGAGVGLLVLYRVNPRWQENLLLTVILYVAGVLTGSLIDFLG